MMLISCELNVCKSIENRRESCYLILDVCENFYKLWDSSEPHSIGEDSESKNRIHVFK